MVKLTKSMPIIKERTCTASMVLDTRTNRKNVSEFLWPSVLLLTADYSIIKLVVLILRRSSQTSAMLQRVHPTIIAYKKNGEIHSQQSTRICWRTLTRVAY